MDQFPYNSPPQTPVKRMINPEPFDTTPLGPLPELPQWLQEKYSTPARQEINSELRPRNTNWITSRAFPPQPQHGRANPETSLRQALEFGFRSRSSDAAKSTAPPLSSQPVSETPTSDVVDEETDRLGYPWPSPRLRQKELAPTPTARLRERELPSPPVPKIPGQYPPEVAGRKTVHFRNTPVVYEVERTGWRPVSEQRRRRHNNRRFRVVEVDRPPIFPDSFTKLAFDLLPWTFFVAFVVVFVGIVAQLKGSAQIAQLDIRTRIPPDFFFTHREFRKLSPEKAPAYEYLSKAGNAGMRHLDQLIRLNKEAERQEKVDGSKKKEWHSLSRRLDWVKIEWDDVLRNVRGAEKELITQSTHWYDTKAAAQCSLHSPQMGSLEALERRKAREGWLEDIRGAASFSAKAIENQSRFVNSSLDTAKRVADMMLPSGCGQWENILLGPDFEEEKPGYLDRLPILYAKFAPSWTSKWLERKRRRMQICSTLVPHLAYFQDYVRIVILSNEHLRAAAQGVTELIGVDDSPATFDDIIPPPVIVTSDDLNLPTISLTSSDEGTAEPAKTPYHPERVEENQTSTTSIVPNHSPGADDRASVRSWGGRFAILKNKVLEWGQFFSPTARLMQLSKWFTAEPGDNEAAPHINGTASPSLSPVHKTDEGASKEALGESQSDTTPQVAGTSPTVPTEPRTEEDASVEKGKESSPIEDEAPPVHVASLTSSPEPTAESVAAGAAAEDGSPFPHPPVPSCEPGSTLPCDLPVQTGGVAVPEAEESIPPSTSSINETPLQRNPHLDNAARIGKEKHPKPATPAAPATIDDIFRAWDKIVGGISLVVEKEFRT